MTTYAEIYKRQSKNVEDIQNKFKEMSGQKPVTTNGLDNTYWTTDHVRGADGIGEATIRILPAPPAKPYTDPITGEVIEPTSPIEPDEVVSFHTYTINRNNKFYSNRGRDSIVGPDGQKLADPANEYNISVWQRKDLDKQEKIKLLANKRQFNIVNILVIEDPNKPENEGKVFRFQYGPWLIRLIEEKMFPKFKSDKALIPWDIVDGADLNIRITTEEIPGFGGKMMKVPNYAGSTFIKRQLCDISDYDEIWQRQYSLQSEIAESTFKSYDELKAHFDRVMGENSHGGVENEEPEDMFDALDGIEDRKPRETKSKPAPAKEASMPWDEELDDDIPSFDEPKESKPKESKKESSGDDWFDSLMS